MKVIRSVRWLLLAFLLSVIPASSYAGVFISVGFAPPPLVVYEQPPCPEPGLMWTPGYWAYGPDGYFWVPGAWVPAPYEGALWTPPYWGWSGGLFVFHDGYWGRHVGYYGGVNYGFGYMGIGFVGGRWHGRDFEYNRAVMHVDERRIHSFYEDRGVVDRSYVDRGSRVAYSGGPGGIRHDPRPEERMAEHEQHTARSSFQQQHEVAARSDKSYYFKNNNGRPQNAAVARPMGGDIHQGPAGGSRQPMNSPGRPQFDNQSRQPSNQAHPGFQPQSRPAFQNQPRPAFQPQPQSRPAPQQHQAPAPKGEHEHR